MTMDDMARRLEAAATQMRQIKAELAGNEFDFDRTGPGADQLATLLAKAWAQQQQLSARLSERFASLSASVSAAAENYRTTDGERF